MAGQIKRRAGAYIAFRLVQQVDGDLFVQIGADNGVKARPVCGADGRQPRAGVQRQGVSVRRGQGKAAAGLRCGEGERLPGADVQPATGRFAPGIREPVDSGKSESSRPKPT